MKRNLEKIDPLTRKHYNEFKDRFQKMNNNELIDAFNRDVGNPGWVSARANFLAALHDEFEDRGFDYSAIGDESCMSMMKKIKLTGMKILTIE